MTSEGEIKSVSWTPTTLTVSMSVVCLLSDLESPGSCPLPVSAELKHFWVQATAMPKGPWKHLLLSTALGSSSYRNPFQGHCPERIDHPFAIWPPESQEVASPTMKNLSWLMIPSLQKWPCHLFNHYSFFLVLSFHVHCLLVCSAQEVKLLQVVNTTGTNPCRAPWAEGTTACPCQPLSQNCLLPGLHLTAEAGMDRHEHFQPRTNDTENEGEKGEKQCKNPVGAIGSCVVRRTWRAPERKHFSVHFPRFVLKRCQTELFRANCKK